MTTVFISDLHLNASRPATIENFLNFARLEDIQVNALYILGDLFEAWIGDDDIDPTNSKVMEALATLTKTETPCFFMHGNRDFLIGDIFADATGCQLIEDPKVVEIEGNQVLLTHGDLLCTDDEPYQELRRIVREPNWQRNFLSKTLEERHAIANDLRSRSLTETAAKPEEIMDVNQNAVKTMMRDHNVKFLLHGHTHRPGVHTFTLDGCQATRIVLGAWDNQSSILLWDKKGFRLETISTEARRLGFSK